VKLRVTAARIVTTEKDERDGEVDDPN